MNKIVGSKWAPWVAAMATAWLCWNGTTAARAQAAANISPQLQEVVKLTQAHMSDDVILAYIHNSGAGYNLSADDILYLNGQGVSQPVLSALLQAKSTAVPTPSTPAPAPIQSAPQVNPPPPDGSGGYPVQPPPVYAPTVETPPPGSDITLNYFQTQLSPYGTWVDVPGEGQCWVPSVQGTTPDWRPYMNGGHWEYTDDGWYWKSDYAWGEYAFHYGRWTRTAPYGWVWVPGYNWGPAWVSWRHAEGLGYCGWAPLPPSARYEVGVGIVWGGRVAMDVDFGLGPDAYVFIPFDHFWAHDYIGFRAPMWRTHDLFRVSLVANNYAFVGGHLFLGGIGRDRMAVLTHHDIHVARIDIRDPHIARAREVQHARAAEVHSRAVEGRDARGFDEHRAGSLDRGTRPSDGRSSESRSTESRSTDSHSSNSRGGPGSKDSGFDK